MSKLLLEIGVKKKVGTLAGSLPGQLRGDGGPAVRGAEAHVRAEGGDKHRPSEGGVAELSLHCRGDTRAARDNSPPLPVGAGRGGVGAQAPHPLHQPLPRRRVFRASGHVAEAAGRGQGRAGGQARCEGEDAAEAGRRGHA